ncbi:hypothetical protein [Hydrogeniiclostridium mannosilyticum]|nr:hypothetical protein [Hydrogeniiclostridium mannosilyticum]
MKDEIGASMAQVTSFEEAKALIDDWMDYYNNGNPPTSYFGSFNIRV